MSTFSKDEVARVADLARIALTQPEIDRLAAELDVIADAVAKVSEVATEQVQAAAAPIALYNVTRADVVGPTLDREELLDAAPAAEAGQFRVPQILGEE